MDMSKKTLFISLLIFLSACTLNQNIRQPLLAVADLPINKHAFKIASDDIHSLQEIFSLTLEQKEGFLQWYESEEYQQLTDVDRIYLYLTNQLESFKYHSNTFVAQEILEQNTGNCLSLAILLTPRNNTVIQDYKKVLY